MPDQLEILTTLIAGPDAYQRMAMPVELTALPFTKSLGDARGEAVRLGFIIGEEQDDLFTAVTPPKGWGLRYTDHGMYKDIVDVKGRLRGSMFYKAASWDRDAFFHFKTRYFIDMEKPDKYWELVRPPIKTHKVTRKVYLTDAELRDEYSGRRGYSSDYPEDFDFALTPYGRSSLMRATGRRPYKMVEVDEPLPDDQQTPPQSYEMRAVVRDRATGAVLFGADPFTHPAEGYKGVQDYEDGARAVCLAWLNEHRPDHNDVVAYW